MGRGRGGGTSATQPPQSPGAHTKTLGTEMVSQTPNAGRNQVESLPGGRAQACLPFGWGALGLGWGPVLASVSYAAAQVASWNPADTRHSGQEAGLSLGLRLPAWKRRVPPSPQTRATTPTFAGRKRRGRDLVI